MLPLLMTMPICQTKVIEDETVIEWQIVSIEEDLEMAGVEKEVEDTEARNIGMIDNIVFYFLENAYNTINLSEHTDTLKCHK